VDCLFCSIVRGEIPSYGIYEDEYLFVMLDKFPKCLGHVLILPKIHSADIFDLGEEESKRLFPMAQRIAKAMTQIMDFDGINVIQNNGPVAGQTVNHFHLHLVPRFKDDNMNITYTQQNPEADEFDNIKHKFIRVLKD